MSDHISSEYSRLDFDGEDEFTLFFACELRLVHNNNDTWLLNFVVPGLTSRPPQYGNTQELNFYIRFSLRFCCAHNVLILEYAISPVAFRCKMVKIVSQVALLMPRTAATEALSLTQEMVAKPSQGNRLLILDSNAHAFILFAN